MGILLPLKSSFKSKASQQYFLLGTALLLLSVAMDLFSTYLAGGGSFEYEQNSIQKKYNLGWVSFSLWLYLVQVPYIVAFYYHAVNFSKSVRYLPYSSHREKIKEYFCRGNSFQYLRFLGAIINFWGYYYIRVNTIYRFIVVVPNNMMGWYDKRYLQKLNVQEGKLFNNKPILLTENPIDLFVYWYQHIYLQDVGYIKIIAEVIISLIVLVLFLNRYILYRPLSVYFTER